jgi:hypothetical protein
MEVALTHYQKYKESIKRNAKRYLENPDNHAKQKAYLIEYQRKRKDAYDKMKELTALLEKPSS